MNETLNLDRAFLRRCFWATGWASAAVALIGWRLGEFDWASRYAAVALFGWLNWFLLAQVLLGLVERRRVRFVVALGGKLVNFGWFVGLYLVMAGAEPSSLLAGLNTFFIVVILKILGLRLRERNSLSFSQTQRPLPPRHSP